MRSARLSPAKATILGISVAASGALGADHAPTPQRTEAAVISPIDQIKEDERIFLHKFAGNCAITSVEDTGKRSKDPSGMHPQGRTMLKIHLEGHENPGIDEARQREKKQLGGVMDSTTEIVAYEDTRDKEGKPLLQFTVGSSATGKLLGPGTEDISGDIYLDPALPTTQHPSKTIALYAVNHTIALPDYKQEGGKNMESYTYCGSFTGTQEPGMGPESVTWVPNNNAGEIPVFVKPNGIQ